MNAVVIPLLADGDRRVLAAYFGADADPSLNALFDAMGVPADPYVPRLDVAVAQVLLEATQDSLPQWGMVDEHDEVVLGRHAFGRAEPAGRLAFVADFICTINWADSGPGVSWPEAYHIFRVPGFGRYVVTASRDSADACGCTDNAIGHCPMDVPPTEAARTLVQAWWKMQVDGWDQARWAYLFDTGLVGRDEAARWADEVWPPGMDEDEEDEHGCDAEDDASAAC